MNNFRRAVLLMTCCAIAGLHAGALSAGEKVGAVDVSVMPLPNKEARTGTSTYSAFSGTSHGYVEFRVQLKNTSPDEQTVYLTYPAKSPYSGRERGVVVSREVHIAGGQEAAVSLFQPPVAVEGAALSVAVKGVKEPRDLPLATIYGGNPYYGYTPPGTTKPAAVLLSRGVPQDFRDLGQPKSPKKSKGKSAGAAENTDDGSESQPAEATLEEMLAAPAAPTPSPPTSPADRFEFLRSELPVGQWSTHWLGYSCYDAIIMTQREAEEMPAAAQAAIRRYIECGGVLLIHGREVPAVFSQGGTPHAPPRSNLRGFIVGLGFAAATLRGDSSDWNDTFQRLLVAPIHIYQPDRKPDNLYGLLVKETTVPVRGLFVLVLAFGIGIGPVNVWVLSRYKRRIWLWWNVPAISLLTCLVVFCYASFSEGWTGHGRTAVLTLLDERCQRAATFGFVSFYCPLTPSSGPRFGSETDLALLDNEPEYTRIFRGHPTGLRFVDWTDGQHLTSGWVKARLPAYFQIRKNEDRRERLIVGESGAAGLSITNALGADLRRVWLADASGRIFEGRDIPAGAKQTLAPTGKTAVKGPNRGPAAIREVYRDIDWLGALNRWSAVTDASELLIPGSYTALLAESPFMEKPLAGITSEDTAAIVFGISKEPDDGR